MLLLPRARLLLAAFVVAWALTPAVALARHATPLVDRAPTRAGVADRVITGRATAAAASVGYARYATAGGDAVRVRLSSAYGDDPAVAQSYADFLGGLPHGSELSLLSVSIETPAEVAADCGGDPSVLACYQPVADLMIVPGEQRADTGGVTTSYVVAHEYGHHVAAHRSNRPFAALDYGPKYWSSDERVCDGVLARHLFPGEETSSLYLANPGEAWAEVYARLKYPSLPWTFTRRLKPDAAALAAARRDIAHPWTHAVHRTFRGRVSSATPARRFRLRLTLDGALTLRLRGPAGSNDDLRVTAAGKVVAQTHAAGSRDRVHFSTACRSRARETVTVTVLRRSGAGPFRVDAAYAG